MIEMDNIKYSIIKQIKFLLINAVNSTQKNFDNHMLHTVLSGGSGCGKTAVGVILAKIWIGMGLIKKLSITDEKTILSETDEKIIKLDNQIYNLDTSNKMKNDVIKRLQTQIYDIKNTIRDFGLNINNYKLRELKRELAINNLRANVIDEIIVANSNIIEKCNEITSMSTTDEAISFITPVNNNKKNVELEVLTELSKTLEKQIEKHKGELEPRHFDLIRVVSREDFVGGFLGQTAIKTEKLLRDSFGKVLFIDEAYSLLYDEKDSYGMEALTVINRFMSEYSDMLVIIFAGYTDLMNKTIFKMQPGLKRRCSWYFDLKGYSETGLAHIFEKQLKEYGYSIKDDVNLINFFKENMKEFPNYGGNTLQLAFYCKLIYSSLVFDQVYENNLVVNNEILNLALVELKENKIQEEDDFHLFEHMFN